MYSDSGGQVAAAFSYDAVVHGYVGSDGLIFVAVKPWVADLYTCDSYIVDVASVHGAAYGRMPEPDAAVSGLCYFAIREHYIFAFVKHNGCIGGGSGLFLVISTPSGLVHRTTEGDSFETDP